MVHYETVELSTGGHTDIKDITELARGVVEGSKIKEGQLSIYIAGSTAGLTSIEYEPGLLQDLPKMLEQIAPMKGQYHHDATWHDGNGYAHLRAALVGPSITVPFESGQFLLGTWQQVVFIDFDNRSRQRTLYVQIYGE